MGCYCQIIPADVFDKLSKDKKFDAEDRKAFADAAALEAKWRKARREQTKLSHFVSTAGIAAGLTGTNTLAPAPAVPVFDCKHTQSLPGTPVANPASAADATVKRVFTETTEVAKFLQTIYGRNSIDGNGMTLLSSVHFDKGFNNAFWNGAQMTYGDGDGKIFIDFTLSNDVMAHELTHGLTQFTTQLNYTNEAGGLNESCSDVFGSMFRQWRKNQAVSQADWLIGKEIMGPAAVARGFTCLRDMADPAAKHCLAPQPKHFKDYKNGMDPHESSGIPNLAFYKAAMAIGGKSWEKAGKVWYGAMSQYAPSPNMKMSAFASRTRKQAAVLFPTDKSVLAAVDAAWKSVGL